MLEVDLMFMLLLIGIVLSIATGLLGLVCLFWGVMVGIMGVGPGGPIRDFGTRLLVGFLPLLLGVVYLVPVMAFRKQSWIVAYGVFTLVAAIIVLAVAMSIALAPRNALLALFLLLAPATALVAYVRAGRRQAGS
jgi:hypothetical protein